MDTMNDAGVAAEAREQARRRVQARRDLRTDTVAYVVVNSALVAVWAISGGYFWPAWVLALWGIGLVMHAYDVFVRRPITEQDIDTELRRRHG
ncbi:MAG TPA: 2TM domain-containing protein [Mycobacteriales bacterium]|nr:2TM domain-containing protein [Mycobacteriales bacterium]